MNAEARYAYFHKYLPKRLLIIHYYNEEVPSGYFDGKNTVKLLCSLIGNEHFTSLAPRVGSSHTEISECFMKSPTSVTDVTLMLLVTGDWQHRYNVTCSDIRSFTKERQLNESWQT